MSLWTQRTPNAALDHRSRVAVPSMGLAATPDITPLTLRTFRQLVYTLRKLGAPDQNVKRIAWAAALMQDGWSEQDAWFDTDKHFPREER